MAKKEVIMGKREVLSLEGKKELDDLGECLIDER